MACQAPGTAWGDRVHLSPDGKQLAYWSNRTLTLFFTTTGASVFEVVVKDPAGQPVTDADVSVQLFMPAMPTMNMPAMRNGTKVPHVGAGVYRGPGQVLMGGHWDVTVTVDKGGQRLGRQQFSLSAK